MKKTQVFLICFIVFIIGLIWLNFLVSRRVQQMTALPPRPKQIQPVASVAPATPPSGKLVLRTWRDVSRRYWENVISAGNIEVARFKRDGDKMFDVTGTIPDGQIEFIDQTKKTFGTVEFLDGQKRGWFREFYETRQLKQETFYRDGKKISNKEYYPDGTLWIETDYADALSPCANRYVGVGKEYAPNGALKFEWSLTNRDSNRYTKAYRRDGSAEVAYFDDRGVRIEPQEVAVPLTTVPATATGQ